MQLNISLTEEELLALLHLPFFRNPNQLSPFYHLQLDEAGVQLDPTQGLTRLYQKGLWDPDIQELTLEGRQLFVPMFAPTARVMIFRGAFAQAPFQEFYIFKKYITQYSEQPSLKARGPFKEYQLVEHLRSIFSDRRSPLTENKLSLFEPEYILLVMLIALHEEGEQPNFDRLLSSVHERLMNSGLEMPVLGLFGPDQQHHRALQSDVLAQSLDSLVADGLIEQNGDGTLFPTDLIGRLFGSIYRTKDLYLLREEFDHGQLLAREVSIFRGEQGYFLGRSTYNDQLDTRIVHLEDMEWHTLYRLINEIARPKDYLPQLTLEVSKRYHAHLRG